MYFTNKYDTYIDFGKNAQKNELKFVFYYDY